MVMLWIFAGAGGDGDDDDDDDDDVFCAQNGNRRAEKARETGTVVQKVEREAAPGRDGSRHPKCEPSSRNATQNVYRHAEIHVGGSVSILYQS